MISLVDDRFRSEARIYSFRFTCEYCAFFDEQLGRCSHEFPNQAHRTVELDRLRQVVFCKEFELA